MENQILHQKILNNVQEIKSYILNHLLFKEPALRDASQHLFKAGGKMIRPFLVKSIYSHFQENSQKIIPIAAAIEILHTFTLVHDDIMDQDALRRGKPTVHTKWGTPIAILAGDTLNASVFDIIGKSEFEASILTRIFIDISQTVIKICEGQAFDLKFESESLVKVEEYLDMICSKTAELFMLSCRISCICAKCSEKELTSFNDFGFNYGMAFQLIDDILGIVGNEKKLGKPIGSDVRRRKKTFLIIYALEHLDPNSQSALKKILSLSEIPDEEIIHGINLINQSGAVKKAKDLASFYIDKAIESLATLNESNEKQMLIDLAKYSLERIF